MTEISIANLFPNALAIAAGATIGIEHQEKILAQLANVPSTEDEVLVALNFEGIEDATPSYIKATVLRLYQASRRHVGALSADEHDELDGGISPLNLVSVILKASDSVRDCIHEVFARRNLAILAGDDLTGDSFDRAVLLGELDLSGLQTLTLACQFTEFQAADLHRLQSGGQKIEVTGWNNRLAELYRRRLLRRRIDGRTNRFIPLTRSITKHRYGQILLRK